MTILFLCRLYKPHIGGVEKHVENVSRILSKTEKIIIITELYDPKLPEHEVFKESEVFRIPVLGVQEGKKKWVIWKWFLNHLDLIWTADIVHAHDVFFWILPFRLFFLRKLFFTTFHGYEVSDPASFKNIIWHKISEIFSRGNICIGDYLSKWYHTYPTVVSYGAVENSAIVSQRRISRAIFIGRLDVDTGIMVYIQACLDLGMPLDIYGDGPLISKAKEYSEVNKLDIRFHGFDSNVTRQISKYKVAFVNGYLSILEAFSQQVPVISVYSTPIKFDYLSMAPFSRYIQICNSPEQIISSIRKSLPDQNAVVEGYNWSRKQTWSKLAEQYKTLWTGKLTQKLQ